MPQQSRGIPAAVTAGSLIPGRAPAAREGRWQRLQRALADEIGLGSVHWRLLVAERVMALLPPFAGKRTRAALYRALGFRIGEKTVIYDRIHLTGPAGLYERLRIGSRCRVNAPCRISLEADVTLGDGVVLGLGVTILTAVHDTSDPCVRAGRLSGRPVVIEDGAWLAANVTVLPGVTIGRGAVVGAGSVVTRSVPEHTLVAGNPARPLRTLEGDATLAPRIS